MKLADFTNDLLFMIIKNCRIEDIARIACVSVRFKSLANNESMLKEHFQYMEKSLQTPRDLLKKVISHYKCAIQQTNHIRYSFFSGFCQGHQNAKDFVLGTPIIHELFSEEEQKKLQDITPIFE